jgi:signal transduction histidine kinase
LVRYRGGRWEPISDGFQTGTINSLLKDHKGRLWIGTSEAGVARIDNPTIDNPRFEFPLNDRLRTKTIFQLAEDAVGRIYIAGARGVERFDPATNALLQLPAASGPPLTETHLLYRDRKGAIWFGSNHGLARYNPEADPSGPPPAVSIHEVRVSGAPVLVSDEGEPHVEIPSFAAGTGVVEIAFGSVDFSVANRIRYRYRLLPAEMDWRQPVAQRSVQFAALGPNHYRFEVQAVGPGGAVNPAVAAVSFHVRTPLWKTWWFLVLAGMAAAALLYSAYLLRLRHQLSLERIRGRLAADLHDDLGSGLAEIAILTEVANQQHPLPGLHMVAERARELRSAMSDIVWAVDPAGDNVESLLDHWRQTAFAMLGDNRLEFRAPDAAIASMVRLTSQQRRNLLLLFKEVVTNIARHAEARRVTVQIVCASGFLKLEIRDDGRGFDQGSTYPGTGLKSIRQRAQKLRGTLNIDSKPGEGTVVSLHVPLRGRRMTM